MDVQSFRDHRWDAIEDRPALRDPDGVLIAVRRPVVVSAPARRMSPAESGLTQRTRPRPRPLVGVMSLAR